MREPTIAELKERIDNGLRRALEKATNRPWSMQTVDDLRIELEASGFTLIDKERNRSYIDERVYSRAMYELNHFRSVANYLTKVCADNDFDMSLRPELPKPPGADDVLGVSIKKDEADALMLRKEWEIKPPASNGHNVLKPGHKTITINGNKIATDVALLSYSEIIGMALGKEADVSSKWRILCHCDKEVQGGELLFGAFVNVVDGLEINVVEDGGYVCR